MNEKRTFCEFTVLRSIVASCSLTVTLRQQVLFRMDCTALELDAVKFAKTAVIYDQKGKYNEAVFYYKVNVATF